MKDDINNFYGKPVKTEGTNKAPCPQPEEVPVDEALEEEENQMTAGDWAELGLAVAGCIPGLGTATSVAEAGIAAAKGDYLGAGISMLGAIPIVGGVAKVVRFAGKSAVFKNIFKIVNAGKKVIGKLKKAVKAASAALGNMLTRAKKTVADKLKLIKDAVEKIAKKRAGKAKPVPRTGPKGVDPNHHNANVLVRDANGNVVSHQRIVSGNMTAEEKAMGYPKGMLASHTEARAVRQIPLKKGETMIITGQQKPCNPCKGAMNRTIRETGANIRYQWRENGRTQRWP